MVSVCPKSNLCMLCFEGAFLALLPSRHSSRTDTERVNGDTG